MSNLLKTEFKTLEVHFLYPSTQESIHKDHEMEFAQRWIAANALEM